MSAYPSRADLRKLHSRSRPSTYRPTAREMRIRRSPNRIRTRHKGKRRHIFHAPCLRPREIVASRLSLRSGRKLGSKLSVAVCGPLLPPRPNPCRAKLRPSRGWRRFAPIGQRNAGCERWPLGLRSTGGLPGSLVRITIEGGMEAVVSMTKRIHVRREDLSNVRRYRTWSGNRSRALLLQQPARAADVLRKST